MPYEQPPFLRLKAIKPDVVGYIKGCFVIPQRLKVWVVRFEDLPDFIAVISILDVVWLNED